MRLAFKIPSYILGAILIVILAGAYLYYFTTIPESELNGWIASLLPSGEDIEINVTRVNRDVWDHLLFEGVSIVPRKQGNAPTVSISRIELDYDLISLIKDRSHYRSLVIDSVSIEFPSAGGLMETRPSAESKFKLPVRASIDRIFINAIDMTLPNREEVRLKGVALSAAAQDNRLDIVLDNLSGQMPSRDIDVYSISGELSYNVDGISLKRFHIVTNRSSITLEGDLDRELTNDIDIRFDFDPIDLTDIRNLTGVKIEGDLKVRGTVKGSPANFGGSALVNGLFFGRKFENLNLDYRFADNILDFTSIDGKIFDASFEGSGQIDLSARPEAYYYNGEIEHLNLVNLGPEIRTDFTGQVDMRGKGLGVDNFSMRIDCDLDSVRIEEYFFDRASGPIHLDLSALEFLEGFEARYKHAFISGSGRMEYLGDIDIRGRSVFQDLTDFTGQIFLKELGGRGNAEFHVTGSTADFDVEALFYSDSCWTYGLEPAELQINANLKSFVSHPVGTVDGSWKGGELYSVPCDSGYFKTSVSGERVFIDTAEVYALDGGLRMRGDYDGTTVPPIFRVDTLLADIYGNRLSSREPLIFFLFDKETEFSKFRLQFGSGSLELKGVVSTDLDLDLDFLAEGFQIQPILRQIYPERKIEGLFSGSSKIRGDFDNPVLTASAKVDNVRIDNFFLGSFESRAGYSDGYLAVEDGRLNTPKGTYAISGRLPLNLTFNEVENRFPNDPIDLHLTAEGNRLILSEVFIPTIDSFFTDYSFDISFTGTYEKPLIAGYGEIKNGFLKTLELETPLTDVNAVIQMENETINIVEASATVSTRQTEVDKVLKDILSRIDTKKEKPIVRASGTMKLLGLGDFLYNIDVTGRNFFFKSDQYDISGIGDFDLKVSGPTPPTVSGDIVITKLDIREEFSSFYDPEYALTDLAIEDSSLWNLNLNINGQNNIWIKNSEVDAEFRADLHVERNVGILGTLGTLEAIRGSYYLVGQKFRFESGMMTYQNVAGINPEIDFIVSTRLRGGEGEASVTNVELNVTGTLFEPRINTTSTSSLSTEDVLRLILERNWMVSGGTRNVVESAGAFVNALGLDPRTAQGIVEEIEFTSGEGQEEKTRVSVAKYVSPDLYLRYSQRLSADNPGRMVGVEYYLNDNVFFKASQGQQSSDYEGISFDINFNIEF